MSEKRAADMIGQLSKENEKLRKGKQELVERLKKNQEFNHNILSYFGWDIEAEDKINELIDKNREVIQKVEGDNDE